MARERQERAPMSKRDKLLRHEDVFNYFRRELTALEPPIDTPEAFKSALRARTNRISRKKSH